MNNQKRVSIYISIVFLFSAIFQNNFAEDFTNNKNSTSQKIQSYSSSLLLLQNYYLSDLTKNEIRDYFSQSDKVEFKSHKSPSLAFGLAMMFPGLGQIYNGEYGKLAIIYGVAIVGAGIGAVAISNSSWGTSKPEPSYVTPLAVTGMSLISVVWLYSIIDAPISANKINESYNQLSLISKTIFNQNNFQINISAGTFDNNYSFGLTMNYGLSK